MWFFCKIIIKLCFIGYGFDFVAADAVFGQGGGD
jgi:hypothetical protein